MRKALVEKVGALEVGRRGVIGNYIVCYLVVDTFSRIDRLDWSIYNVNTL